MTLTERFKKWTSYTSVVPKMVPESSTVNTGEVWGAVHDLLGIWNQNSNTVNNEKCSSYLSISVFKLPNNKAISRCVQPKLNVSLCNIV